MLLWCAVISIPSETQHKLKSREISFVHDTNIISLIVLIFCTEYDSITAVPGTKHRNDWVIERYVMDKHDFTRFQFNTNFGFWRDIFYCNSPLNRIELVAIGLYILFPSSEILSIQNKWSVSHSPFNPMVKLTCCYHHLNPIFEDLKLWNAFNTLINYVKLVNIVALCLFYITFRAWLSWMGLLS